MHVVRGRRDDARGDEPQQEEDRAAALEHASGPEERRCLRGLGLQQDDGAGDERDPADVEPEGRREETPTVACSLSQPQGTV